MSMSLGGWSILGIAAAIAIAAGIILLVVYALQRGLHHRELDGTEAPEAGVGPVTDAPGSVAGADRPRGRTLGIAGAVILLVGLGLGLLSTMSGWGGTTAGSGPAGPNDCAQSWSGCPQATPAP